MIPETITKESVPKFFNGHHLHHMFPNQEYRIVVSLPHIAKITLAFWTIMIPFGYFFFNFPYSGLVFTFALDSGVIAGQIYYDTLHFWFHFGGDFKFKWMQRLKEKHMVHHYRDIDGDFGVTTCFWDHVFGTNLTS